MSSKAPSRKSIKENDALDLNNLREAVEHAIEVNDTASIVSSTSLIWLIWVICLLTQHTEFYQSVSLVFCIYSVYQMVLSNCYLL